MKRLNRRLSTIRTFHDRAVNRAAWVRIEFCEPWGWTGRYDIVWEWVLDQGESRMFGYSSLRKTLQAAERHARAQTPRPGLTFHADQAVTP